MRFWAPLAALVLAFSCEKRCNDDDNVGGGSAGVEVVMHVRVVRPEALLGNDSRRDVVATLGVDEQIVEQVDTTQAIDVLVGSGKQGVESYAAMVPLPTAQTELAKRYDLEPLMLRQVRIKPPRDRARCLFVRDHVACALGDARLGRGTFDAEEWARVAQVSAEPDVMFSLRVVQSAAFSELLWPIVRAHLDRAFTRAKVGAALRELVLTAHWEDVGRALDTAHVVGSAREEMVSLQVQVPWSLPSAWGPAGGAPELTATPGFVAVAWCEGDDAAVAPELAPVRSALGCRARALRIRDGAQVELHAWNAASVDREDVDRTLAANPRLHLHDGVLTSSDDAEAAREGASLRVGTSLDGVVASAFVDLAVVGVEGGVHAKLLRRDPEGTTVSLTMPRASFVALWRVLATGL